MAELYLISIDDGVEVVELMIPQMLDSQEFDSLNIGLLKLLEGRAKPRWVLELSNVPYAGSALLGLMVNVRHRIKAGGGKLILCGLSPILTDIFLTSSLERLFTIVRDRTSAVRELQ